MEYALNPNDWNRSTVWLNSDDALREMCRAKISDRICRPENPRAQIKQKIAEQQVRGIAKNSKF